MPSISKNCLPHGENSERENVDEILSQLAELLVDDFLEKSREKNGIRKTD